ncbi:hypothetical protein J6590_042873 [Homalodisca vitripennis]|nr:hypothetical protein J6590_042873 [Homalodisca vitripennis]
MESWFSCYQELHPKCLSQFMDSQIAGKISLERIKIGYLVNFGIVEYFRDLLDKEVQESSAFVSILDESMNKVSQNKEGSLKSLRTFLTAPVFDLAALNVLEGRQVIVRGDIPALVQATVLTLKSLLPGDWCKTVPESDEYLEPRVCRLLGVSTQVAVPRPCQNIVRIDLVQGSVSAKTTATLPVKCTAVYCVIGQTRRTSPADGTHGDPIESQHNQISQPWASGRAVNTEQPENQVASAERVRPLRTVVAAGKQLVNHLTSTNQSIQAENNQYFDGVTPPPTDKSGRGGKGPTLASKILKALGSDLLRGKALAFHLQAFFQEWAHIAKLVHLTRTENAAGLLVSLGVKPQDQHLISYWSHNLCQS